MCSTCKYLCCRCGFQIVFDNPGPDKTICSICGAVNLLPEEDPGTDWLHCITPTSFEWNMTSGVMGPDVPMKEENGKTWIDYDGLVAIPMTARVIYTTATGDQMARADWIRQRGVDPAIELKNMRNRMKKPRPVYVIG
jgi:hypothetical protein